MESLDADTVDPYVASWKDAAIEVALNSLFPLWCFETVRFHAIWTAVNVLEYAATLLLTAEAEWERLLARAVLERKIVIN